MLTLVVKGNHLEEQIAYANQHAEALEMRLDQIVQKNIKMLRALSTVPVIFTLRKKSHGGFYKGTAKEREVEIEKLLDCTPDYFDLEYDTDPAFVRAICAKHPEVKIISSYHNFEKTPNNLDEIYHQIQCFPAYGHKIATMARSALDAVRMLIFLKKNRCNGHKLTAICMGKEGECTRILSPLFGNLFTFVMKGSGSESAPGQLSLETLISTYNYRDLNENTQIYGLIGDPVNKSFSQITHNQVFKEFNINAVYIKLRITPKELAVFFTLIQELPFKGLSVTMPLKESLVDHLEFIDEQAQEIGAINTLYLKEEGWWGYNTDSDGALNAIEKRELVQDKTVIVLGAGGTGKAIAYGTIKRGANVIILNRSKDKAVDLAKHLGCIGDTIKSLSKYPSWHILINTTPVGMLPNVNEMPINPEEILPDRVVMDAIWNPLTTKLLKEAKQSGCQIIQGYEMFIHQATLQFCIYFNGSVDKKKILHILDRACQSAF